MLLRVDLFRADDSEEHIASIIKVTRIDELGTIVVIRSLLRLLVIANVPSSPIIVTLMIEATLPPNRRFLQELHYVTFHRMTFFRVTAVKTWNLT
jgi:hypothetical protein